MCLMIPLIEDLCNVRVPIGQSELVIKDISFLYNSLNTLTKYFITRSSKLNLAFRSARYVNDNFSFYFEIYFGLL